MSLSAILLGIINIAIVVAILLLVGAVILWFCSWMNLARACECAEGLHHRGRSDRTVYARCADARHPVHQDHRIISVGKASNIEYPPPLPAPPSIIKPER